MNARDRELDRELDRPATPPEPSAEVKAAREEVLAARAALLGEATRLEGSVRAAVDIPARVRRAPAKTAGAAAGAAFFLLGGPGRVLRGVRRAVMGPGADLPKSLLPDQVEKEVRKLGADGNRVRAVLEREFASYLEEKSQVRRERDLVGTIAFLAGNLLKPVSLQAGKRLAEQLANADSQTVAEGIEKARARAEQRKAQRQG